MRPERRGPRRDLRVLTPQQEDHLGRGFTALRGSVPFASDEDEDEAWRIHGARIMEAWAVPYRRPRGWWRAKGEGVPPRAAEELKRLIRLGELSAQELAGLAASLTPSLAREVVADGLLEHLPTAVAAEIAGSPNLFLTLTEKGREHFMDGLGRESWKTVTAGQHSPDTTED